MYNLNFYREDTSFIKPNGVKGNVELRLYNYSLNRNVIAHATDLQGTYIGINFFYRQTKDNRVVRYHHSNDTTSLTDYFIGNKKNWGTNFVIGYQENISNRFTVELYGEIGIMYRFSKDYNIEYNYNTDSLNRRSYDSYLPKNNG